MASEALSSTVLHEEHNTLEKYAWPKALDRLTSAHDASVYERKDLLDNETKQRKRGAHSALTLVLINGCATILVFLLHLISIESLLSMALSVALTVYTFNVTDDDVSWDGSIMDWILLSFAIVTPMSSSIGMAFTRRENALIFIAKLRAYFFGLYQAHASWDWGTLPQTGRDKSSVDWLEHSDCVLKDIIYISDDISRYLTLPSTTRARHRVLPSGKKQAKDMKPVSNKLVEDIQIRVNRISLYCEILKLEGLPGNEAARIRQWERNVLEAFEGLQVIKEYRTPQALRSLCRIFTLVLPPYYAPYYAQMARDLDSLPMAIVFSILTSLALTALFESLAQLEDPFVATLTLDGIDVPREVCQLSYDRLLNQRNKVFFPNCNRPFKIERGCESPEAATKEVARIFGE